MVDRDGDSDKANQIWDSLPPTVEVATSRGRHRYYSVPKGTNVRSRKLAEDVDLKADGGYVAAPPSVHPSGARYRWISGRSEMAPLPDDLIEADPTPQPSRRREGSAIGLETGPIPEGSRNETLTRIAGRLHDGTRDPETLATDLIVGSVPPERAGGRQASPRLAPSSAVRWASQSSAASVPPSTAAR